MSLCGESQNECVTLSHRELNMEEQYVGLITQKQEVTLNNCGPVVVHFRWTIFASDELEHQHREALVQISWLLF